MGFYVPRQTADVVNDNHEVLTVGVLPEVREHRLHAGAGRYSPGYRFIDEDPVHVIALHAGKFTATGFLRSEALSSTDLRRRRHPRIDDGFGISRLDSGVRRHDLTLPHFGVGGRMRHAAPGNYPQPRVRTFSRWDVL
jgi:hypothetical protein